MYKKNKRKLAVTVIFFFLSTIFYNIVPGITAYADGLINVGAYQVGLTAQPATQGGQATINGNITIGNENGNYNVPITIKVPSDLTKVSLNSTGLAGFFTATESNGVITLTPLPAASNMQSASFSISGTLSSGMGTGPQNIPATINGQSAPIPISIASPGGNSGSSSSSSGNSGSSDSGGYVPPPPTTNGLNGVNLNQPIGKYFSPAAIGGKFTNSQTIPRLNGGNNTINYTVFVNSNLASGNTFTDDIPQGMSYIPNSLAITQIPKNNVIATDGTGAIQVSCNNNKLQVSGFSALGAGTYELTYQCVVSLQYAESHFDATLSNVGHFGGNTSTAKLTINTEKSHFNPSEENGMITKTVNKTVFKDGTSTLNYKLTVNPREVNISNAKIVDKLPAGITLQNIDSNPYSPNYGNVSVYVFKNGNPLPTPFNICDIDSNGNQSYPLGEYPQNQVLGTLYYNQQTNEISVDIPSANDKIIINYSVNVAPNAKNIANTATINNDGVSASSTAVSQYASNSTALGMWKTAYWINNSGQKVESGPIENRKSTLDIDGATNPNVTYVIHVQNNGAYFPNGELDFRDPIAQGAKILNVKTPQDIGYTIKNNTVYFKNNGYVEPGSFDVEITCSLANFKGGSTIDNTAYKGSWGTDTVIVHKKSNTNEEKPGSLTITKTGVDGSKLQGAEFTVTGPNNSSKTITTNENGVGTLNDLPWGTYTVKETVAPVGYNLNPNAQTVTIGKQNNGTVEVNQNITVKDTGILGSIKVVKTDSQTGKLVEGATFTATNTATNQTFTGTTGTDGIAQITELPWGTYNVQETKAPNGYQVNSKVNTVTINAQSFNSKGIFQEPTLNVADNEMLGNLTVTKTGVDGSKLQGAQFTVKGPNGVDKVITTDKDGVASLSNLAWGTYTVQETKAPVGYTINSKTENVVIGKQQDGSINLNGSVSVKDNALLGQLQITKTNENGKTKLEGAQFTVTGPNGYNKVVTTNADGVASLSNLAWGTYTVQETGAPQGYNLNSQTQTVDVTNATVGQVQGVKFKDSEVLGNMQIVKTGINDIKLEGAQFTVTGPNGYKEVVTTNKDGVANLSNLAWGQYNVQETKAPAGYNLDKTVQTVNIDAKDATKLQTVAVKDAETTGTLEIEKTDATNEKEVAGAKIQITGTSTNGQKVDIKFTSGTTPTKFTLPAGTYTYREVDAPVGYQINTTVGHFTISEQGQIVKADVKDARVLGAMTVTKTGKGGVKLEGAQFTITGPNGFKEVVTTNADGVASLNNLAWGDYTVKETKAPTGYNINSQAQTVTIDAQDATNVQAVTVSDTQILGQISITKTNENGTEKLQGAEFTVTGPNGFNQVVTTNADGVASLNNLAWGTYTVKETKAPAGYNLNPETQTVTVTEDNASQVKNIVEKDTVTTGTLNIEKTDITNEKEVAGAKIQITGTALDGQKIDKTFVSGTTPTKFTLPAGTYTYKEVDAPVGYQINTTVGHFTISEQGQIVKADVKDARILGNMQIVKTGINGTKLEGAQFTVTGPNGYKEVVTTNKDGVANLNNLAWGQYNVQETKAPAGYNLDEAVQTVNIDANNAAKLQTVAVNDAETTGTLEIEKTDVTNEKEVAGAKIQITGTSDNGQKVDIKFTSGTTPTKFTLPAGTYTYKEVDAPVGYQINTTVGHFTISEQGQIVKADVKDARILGSMQIVKTGINGTKLEGAEFTVTGPNGFDKVVTTDKDGVANLDNLAWGTYSVKETKAPAGYNLNTEVQTVNIDANDAAKLQTVAVNDIETTGTLEIEKTDATNEKEVAGAKIQITGTSDNGQKVDIKFTSGTTPTKFTLPAGTYTYTEVDAPVGYQINKTVGQFTISKQGQIVKADVKDARVLGQMSIIKTGKDGIKLEGAEFTVTGPNGFDKVITTNKDGVANLDNLAWGTYTVKETKAPIGYSLNNTSKTITIDAQDTAKVQELTVSDNQILGQISITKTNENGSKKLEGAEFTVTGPNGFSKVVTTDKDGIVNLDNLAWGTYTVKETKAPIGYNLNPEVQTVEVTAASVGKVQSVTEKDTVTTGTLNIEKTDITNEKEVAGAKIQITGKALDGQKIDITFTSGTTPTKFTLPAGTYTYTEVDAPVGYLINKTVGHFTISEQGQIVKADVKDARVLGQMTITKTNEKGTEKLEGAQFTVTGPNGYKEVVTTDKDGVISLNNLAWGTYKVQETKAPVGYNLNPEVQTVNIEANDAAKIQALTEKDTATTGTLVIEKTDVTNEKEVAGAKIQITGTSVLGKKIDITFTSGTTPTKFTLPAGTYTYTEVDAPVGYLINKTVGHFTISEQGQIVKADVKDARILGQMTITKTNENGTEKLEGAQFTVTGPNGYKEVLTTNKDGVINLKDLAWGTYTVKETKAPIGYSLNNDVQTVKIDAQDAAKVQSVSIKDAKILGQISITKTNENGTVKLQGAEFTVTGPNGYKEVVTTNKDGVANLKDLAWGTYKVQETKAPVGYSLNNEVQTVEVTAASVGKVQSVSVKDNQILGNLTITKTNENGTEMLQGAEFKVTGPNGFSKVVTTGANGIASLSDLEWGTYYVKEIKAPQGYNINNTIYTVNINAQDALQVQAVKVKDSKIQEVYNTNNNTNSNTDNNNVKGNNTNNASGNNTRGLSPQTSDASQLPIYILLGVAIVGLILNTRRKKKTAK